MDYSTLSKRLDELDYLIIKPIFELIVGRLNRVARRKMKVEKELLALDSTTVTVGKNCLTGALYHGERSGVRLRISFINSTGMPLHVVETTDLKQDDPIGVELEDKCFIIVADRTCFSIDKGDCYAKTNQDFVIRLKDNIQLNHKKSLKRTSVEESNIVVDFTCTLGPIQKQTQRRHRVVEFTDYEGAIVHVVTNLRDVTAEEIAGMHKERWAIESFFRCIKRNLNVPVLFGTT